MACKKDLSKDTEKQMLEYSEHLPKERKPMRNNLRRDQLREVQRKKL